MADRRLAWALVTVIVRYLTTIQPHAHREFARWRRHARAIPDPELRAHVLRPFDADGSAAGAALFAVLAPLRAQRRLVRLLVAYVLLWSYVDVRTERHPEPDARLYDALLDGLRTDAPSPVSLDDDGYLEALLAECRCCCAALPSWKVVESAALRLAHDGRTVQAINHGPRPQAETRLCAWAAARDPARPWHEQCAAASSPLAIHALMALAAHPSATASQANATATAYGPVSALGVLCDHLIDQREDHELANHSYLRYLDSSHARARELRDVADCASGSVRGLRGPERHTVILAAMAAMFLTGEHSRSAANSETSQAVLDALGPPTPVLLATLRIARRLRRRRASAA
jgi:tetraprenyl-beta-curcumene synthase